MVNYKLEIANSRGKKPVINDLKKAQLLLSNLIFELNHNEAREQLKIADTILFHIINDPQNK